MKSFFLIVFIFISCFISAQPTGVYNQSVEEFLEGDPAVAGGYIEVPEDHDQPTGRKIKVAYAVLKSKSAQPQYPLIIFNGGPGENSIENYKGLLDFPFLENRDIILFDQRGIGFSTGLSNMGQDVFNMLAKDLSLDEEYKMMREIVIKHKNIITSSGLDLQHINTFQNARDVGAIMDHLGYDKYIFFGGSYGTKLARSTMDFFPDKVYCAILSAPAPWEKDFLTFRIDNFKNALKLIFRHCEDDEICNNEYPRLRKDYVEAIKNLEHNPIEANIQDTPFYINPQDAMYLLRYQLYTQDAQERVPKFIRALKERDIEYINSSQQFVGYVFQAVNFSMNLSIGRFEEYDKTINRSTIDGYYTDKDYFPSPLAFFNSFYLAGVDWHGGKADSKSLNFRTSDIPSLIFVNKYDPVTPPENGHIFKKTLNKGQLFVLDEGGHSGGGECRIKMMSDFIQNPDIVLDTSCLNLVEKK